MNVLFDLGNVVIHWDTQDVVDGLDVPRAQKELIKRELFDHTDWSDLDHGITTEPQVVQRICDRTTLTPGVVNQALEAARLSLTPISESVELMHQLYSAGLPIYCLSNMSIETYRHIKDKMDFFDLFKGVVISGLEKCMKPNPAVFKLALNRFSLDASSTFFIDDSEANILAASELGIQSYHFKRTAQCYTDIRQHLL